MLADFRSQIIKEIERDKREFLNAMVISLKLFLSSHIPFHPYKFKSKGYYIIDMSNGI